MKVPEACNANMTSLPIDIVHSLVKSQTSFRAGKLKHFLPQREAITADPTILQIVTGVKIEFKSSVAPTQHYGRPSVFNSHQHSIVNAEIDTLLAEGVVTPAAQETEEFISTIFLRLKKDGTHRTIVNLKAFNELIAHHHFKMDTLEAAVNMMRPGCFMALVDLEDAYYTVPIRGRLFDEILLRHPGLGFDLFASRLNNQIGSYCSWQADPNSTHADAFTMNWNWHKFYAFPPFSLLPRCLQKMSQDRAQGVLIAPLWPTQTWFPVLLQHLCEQPWILLPRPDLLQQPFRSGPHPLHRSLHLMVCPVSDPSAVTTFQRRLPTFSWHLGGQALKNSMPHTLKNGWNFVVKVKLIIIHHHRAMPFNFSRGCFVKGLATQPLILLVLPCLPLLR